MNSVTKLRTRTTFGALLLASSTLLSACLKSTGPQDSQLDLAGTWHYTGSQTGSVRESLDGTLTITRESGVSFQGQLVLQAVNEQTGISRPLNGAVSGSESGIDLIDFDADIESSTRRHVGTIVADTIAGNWITSSDGSKSGTFKVVRETR
jgi:hypothetical protein